VLRVTVSWLIVVLGAIAPFGLAAALLGFLVYRAVRWFARRRPRPQAAPPDR